MQLRYAFRLDPTPGQRAALARAFGCARVVYNDAVAARERARAAGEAFPTAAVLSKRLVTEAKKSPERHWLAEVSAVVLQQALRDAESAYRNFFASLKGARKGTRVGAPRFKSRKDERQSVRFTANARWKITETGRVSLPKIGEVRVRWSRYGRTFVKTGRFEPTSQVCSTCGHRDGPKPLNVREWTCTACSTLHDRDHNAAKNIKAAGLAVTACGAPVRPEPLLAQRDETGSHGSPPDVRAP
ncbi:RNA-guided endonuclease InsQ/TnpB family protein [Streptomyces sp. NPDC007856]|uniref:RNA-guided endonuclease InsQ/TnpB family protein n=1 Tax=Streptomyces sp. NPDC007856 TaxID=3364781 RepID=UPI00369E44EF